MVSLVSNGPGSFMEFFYTRFSLKTATCSSRGVQKAAAADSAMAEAALLGLCKDVQGLARHCNR